jgi:phosphoglycerate dehydrogenase-like enzyme
MTSTDTTYHLHLETQYGRPVHLAPTEAAWHAAANRHPELARLIRITAGTDADIRDEALKTADFTIDSTPPRERLRERAPRLKWIQTTGAGLDPILPLDWLPPGVTLTNNRGAHGRKAEDSVTLALLALHVRLPALLEQQRNRMWNEILTAPIAGLTAVVLGFGDLGQAAGRAAHKLGLRVIAVSRSGKASPPADEAYPVAALDDVLPGADFLVIAAPLLPGTRALITRARLGLLKRTAAVVNIGRAAIVDYTALREKLERRELAGAVLDVFEEEPLPPQSPWWTTPGVIVLPHVSCDTPGYIDRLFDFWFANFARFLRGEPLVNAVDPKLGY